MKLRIVPVVFLLYIIAFLDRINIGFAAFTMNADLGIGSAQYGLLTGIFFIGYALFEVPSNLLLHRFGGRVWIARILITWGIVATLTGFVRTVPQLYAARFLLGIAEAGFFPGIVLYLTYWFRQKEQAQVLALFIAAAPVSGVIGSPLSGFILDHAHWAPLASWRWLLILEGIPAVIAGVLTYLYLPSRPSEARFLTDTQKQWIATELDREAQTKSAHHDRKGLAALAQARVWWLAAIYFGYQIGVYALYFWMPRAVRVLFASRSNSFAGFAAILTYAAGLVAMILVSRSSDRRMERRYHGAIPLLIAAVAFLFVRSSGSAALSLALWAVVAMGVSSFNGPFWALPSEFLAGASAAAGIAFVNSVGNLGGFAGPYAIGWFGERAGNSYAGLPLASASLCVAAIATILLPKRFRTRQ
ncbi:MAG TPA: MFS transporter [Terriglobales bacterium]